MALVATIEIGSKVGWSSIVGGVNKITASLRGLRAASSGGGGGGGGGGMLSSMASIAGGIGLASGIRAATGAVTGFFSSAISGASDLNESLNKTQAVFGSATGEVTGLADQMAASFGTPKKEILDAAAAIGLIGTGVGQSQSQAANMATTMAKLAADASSFYNVGLDDALNKIRSGLVGESEPLRAFGVILSEDAVKAKALAMGLVKGKEELDDQAKIAARAQLIMEGLKTASGDLEKTADAPANAMRRVSGQIENLTTEVGQTLMPAFGALLSAASEAIGAMGAMFSGWKSSFEAASSVIIEGLNTVMVLFRNLPEVGQITWLSIQEGALNFLAILDTIPTNLGIIASYFAGNWREIITDGVKAVWTAFSNLGTNIVEMWRAVQEFFKTGQFEPNFQDMLAGYKAILSKFPDMVKPQFVSMAKEIAEATDRMAENEAKRAAAAIPKAVAGAAAPALGDLGGGVKKKIGAGAGKEQTTGAALYGSTEAASAIARAWNAGGTMDKAADQTAKNTGETVKGINKMQAALTAIAARGGSGQFATYTI